MRIRLLTLATLLVAAALVRPMLAQAQFFDCTVIEVGELDGNRFHAKCAAPISVGTASVQFIAMSNTSEAGKRFLSLATSALLSGRPMSVDLGTSATGGSGFPANVTGCKSTDCRTPKSFVLLK